MGSNYVIAAIITSIFSACVIGGFLFHGKSPDERRAYIPLILMMLPMSALAYFAVRLPLDSIVHSAMTQHADAHLFIKTFYAPFTEEPAKLWPLLIPFFFKRIGAQNIFYAAIAVGLGFGIGEAWTVGYIFSQNPQTIVYPWYMLTGYMFERFSVCILHAAFTCAAMHFIIRKKMIIPGLLAGMSLHYLGNFPIYLARIDAFHLGKDSWKTALLIWTNLYLIAAIFFLARYRFKKLWLEKLFRGTMKCPGCGAVYRRPVFKLNLVSKSYERCPSCKKWHMVSAFDYRE